MHKKHIFLRVFQKIALFACVFCAFSAWAETTTCDINYTPVTGNSIQNGTPTPTNPVEIESIGTKIGNKYQIQVVAHGKNLLTGEGGVNGFIDGGNGQVVTNKRDWCSDYIPVKPNTQYYISSAPLPSTLWSGIYAYYDENKEYITGTRLWIQKYDRVLTTHSNAKYIRISIEAPTGTTLTSSAFADKEVQLELGSTATPYDPYSAPITTNVYLDEPLRKVGEYADVLDYKNGTITRNVGVKVLDGTENWTARSGLTNGFVANNVVTDAKLNAGIAMCSHYKYNAGTNLIDGEFNWSTTENNRIIIRDSSFTTVSDVKAYLAEQYAAGTPVIVYYPLATPVVEQIENWSCIPPITDIKIATTKFVDEEFKAAEDQLAATVQTIESVVSRTIAQTGQIQILQDTKQTRPDESCPANMKCLLVQDEDGTPHWYPIIEP